jgi:unsaturated chondroitin disaccharide hydrolase
LRLTAAVTAVAAAALAVACGSGSEARSSAATPRNVQVLGNASLAQPGRATLVRAIPPQWAISFDVRLDAGGELGIGFGSGPAALRLRLGRPGGVPTLADGATHVALRPRPGWLNDGWLHVEATSRSVSIDGRRFPAPGGGGASTIRFRADRGGARVSALIVTGADRGALLLHRLAELHARVPPGLFPLGADRRFRIRLAANDWTSGFWPGALWQAAALLGRQGGLFERWALAATLDHLGQEHTDSHDVGFMYAQSSLAAWQALCGRAGDPASLCSRLKQSVLSAADELRALASSNSAGGTIPIDDHGLQADTIIDSVMNIAILPWATRMTGDPAYAALASRHAQLVASLLVRPDGSTAQSAHFDRATGKLLLIHTHQGLSNSSTWSRGQGWAVYGFAQAAVALRDRGLLRVAQHLAGFVARHLPQAGVPRWDYNAPRGAPIDVSAGVVTAAGLFHLVDACRSLPGVCSRPGQWRALARRMLTASLGVVRNQPPLGFLGSQVGNERARGCWCNRTELIFGLSYALEALRLESVGTTS